MWRFSDNRRISRGNSLVINIQVKLWQVEIDINEEISLERKMERNLYGKKTYRN